MARIDKVDPLGGLFRAALAGSWAGSATPIAVGLDNTGKVVAGAGNTGVKGILCEPKPYSAGAKVDVIKIGELVEFAGVAGTTYTADTTTGAITSHAVDATHVEVGFTIEADHLVVDICSTLPAGAFA